MPDANISTLTLPNAGYIIRAHASVMKLRGASGLMSVRVRWFPTLVKRTRSKQPITEAPWRTGLTPLAIFLDEGFEPADADPVLAIVNGTQTTMEAELNQGDELEFLIGISGG